MLGESSINNQQQELAAHIFNTMAALTSDEETCRKRLIDNKKILDELLTGIKSNNRDVKLAATTCFVSLLRSDKMLKSIILEAIDFHKELIIIFLSSDLDHNL